LQCHTLHSKFKYHCVGDASLFRDEKMTKIFSWARGTSCTPAQRRHPCRHTIEQPSMIQKYKKMNW